MNWFSPKRWRHGGRRVVIGVVAAAVVAAALPAVGATNASWQHNEWASASVGTQNCATASNYATRGASKLLGGTVLGTNLDAAAAVNGPTVTNGAGGVVVTPVPPASQSLGSNAYANPLDVTALSALNLQLGGILTLPLNTNVGVVNQYAQAQTSGHSAGAAGVVDNSGGIDLATSPPSASLPTFATLDLKTVLGTLGLGNVANLTDVSLALGAVASSATLDTCNAQWAKNIYANLQRNYVVAGLNAQVNSPLTSQLVSTVNTTTSGLTTTVNALSGNQSLLSALASGVTGVLGTTLGGLGLGAPTVTVSATANFASLTTILNQTISDPQGIVAISPSAGTITINAAALFNSTNGLNKLAPNTQLLINAPVINALTTSITTALAAYVTSVTTAITAALQAVSVSVTATVPLSSTLLSGLGTIASLQLTATNVSLGSLLNGTAPITVSTQKTSGLCSIVIVGATVCGLVDALVGLVTPLLGALGTALGTPIYALLSPAVPALVTSLAPITSGIVTVLSSTLSGLFGAGSLLSVVVNAQNAPDPAVAVSTNPLPSWAASLPGPTTVPYSTGRYDVSALRIVVVGAVGSGIALDVGRSSVGSNGPSS